MRTTARRKERGGTRNLPGDPQRRPGRRPWGDWSGKIMLGGGGHVLRRYGPGYVREKAEGLHEVQFYGPCQAGGITGPPRVFFHSKRYRKNTQEEKAKHLFGIGRYRAQLGHNHRQRKGQNRQLHLYEGR